MQRKILRYIIPAIILAFPAVSFALELTYPTFRGITIADDLSLDRLIAWFYYLIVGISGLAAFATIIRGGVIWLTSAGSPTKAAEAKDLISSAFFGLLIVLGSWLILQVINPDLTKLNIPVLQSLSEEEAGKLDISRGDGLPGPAQPTVDFTVNGQPDGATITPGGTAALAWNVSAEHCDIQGNPENPEWAGELPSKNGSKSLTLPTAGNYAFYIFCYENFTTQKQVLVTVSSGTGPSPTVDLKISKRETNGDTVFVDGSVDSDEVPYGGFTLKWTSVNANQCTATAGDWAVLNSMPNGEFGPSAPGAFCTPSGPKVFTIVCSNDNGTSPPDSVTLNCIR